MLLVASAAIVNFAAAACDEEQQQATAPPTETALATATAVPGEGEVVTLVGTLTLDGAPLEAEFLGARALRDGLPAACQASIPEVIAGEYEIGVLSDAAARGCGAPGAEIMLWTFTDDSYLFSNEMLAWPTGAVPFVRFDATFSSDTPEGAGTPVSEFKGHLFGSDGSELPNGTVVEAYTGDVRCGVTSLRYDSEDVERLYTLIVAGPEAVAGCAEGATLTFRLDGEPAAETAINDLGAGSQGHELDLSLR